MVSQGRGAGVYNGRISKSNAAIREQARTQYACATRVPAPPSQCRRSTVIADDVRTYSGRVEFGEDLMVIAINDEVVVRRRGANVLREKGRALHSRSTSMNPARVPRPWKLT